MTVYDLFPCPSSPVGRSELGMGFGMELGMKFGMGFGIWYGIWYGLGMALV